MTLINAAKVWEKIVDKFVRTINIYIKRDVRIPQRYSHDEVKSEVGKKCTRSVMPFAQIEPVEK